MLSVDEALEVIRGASPRPRTSQQPLDWTLTGRVLAADVFAAVSLPPFATSAMDGYAVHAADLGGAPVPIAFRVAAGDRRAVCRRAAAPASPPALRFRRAPTRWCRSRTRASRTG